MSRINVLVLITVMDRAGAETMMMNYLRNIDRDKIHMDFLINREERADYEDEIEELGSRVYHMCALYPGKFKRYKREFRQFLMEHPDYQIIHSNLEERSYFALKIAKEMGIPVRIAHAHSAPRGLDLKMVVRLYFRKRLQRYCTHKIACGEKAAKWLFGNDVQMMYMGQYLEESMREQGDKPKKNIAIIMRNAIHTGEFVYDEKIRKIERKKLKADKETLVIGHIGRFTPNKNQSFLIDIFKNVNSSSKNSLLVLIGGGKSKEEIKYKEEIIKKVRNAGLNSRVRFLGIRDDINKLMQAMDIFVMPSQSEGFPVTLVEAQAAGLKCLVSDSVCNDVNITTEIQYQSLENLPEEWANKIFSFAGAEVQNKIEMNQTVVEKGYDIRENAKCLERFYVSEANEK